MNEYHECRPLPRFVRAYGREPLLGEAYLCKPCGKAWEVTTDALGQKTFTRAHRTRSLLSWITRTFNAKETR